MSLPRSETLYTEEEYLALERTSEERHEYLDGKIYLMAGESINHGDICVNLVGQFYNQLKGSPCRALSKDMKVRSGPIPKPGRSTEGLYSYPDIVVVCGEPRFHDEFRDVLLNPKVIIEVLSLSTEAFDRGEKFWRYRTYLESLTDYLVISQTRLLVEHFKREENGLWIIKPPVVDLDESVEIPSIGCALRMNEIYDRVLFDIPPDDPDIQ